MAPAPPESRPAAAPDALPPIELPPLDVAEAAEAEAEAVPAVLPWAASAAAPRGSARARPLRGRGHAASGANARKDSWGQRDAAKRIPLCSTVL